MKRRGQRLSSDFPVRNQVRTTMPGSLPTAIARLTKHRQRFRAGCKAKQGAAWEAAVAAVGAAQAQGIAHVRCSEQRQRIHVGEPAQSACREAASQRLAARGGEGAYVQCAKDPRPSADSDTGTEYE
jgi:hypothetical protein